MAMVLMFFVPKEWLGKSVKVILLDKSCFHYRHIQVNISNSYNYTLINTYRMKIDM
jgi:hypothetical protein